MTVNTSEKLFIFLLAFNRITLFFSIFIAVLHIHLVKRYAYGLLTRFGTEVSKILCVWVTHCVTYCTFNWLSHKNYVVIALRHYIWQFT